MTPADLYAIGLWYDHLPQLSGDDIRTVLARAAAEPAAASVATPRRAEELDGEADQALSNTWGRR